MIKKQISCIEIDIDGNCDLQCPFCYFIKKPDEKKQIAGDRLIDDIYVKNQVAHDHHLIEKQACTHTDNKLSFKEIKDLIYQANQLGTKKVILFTHLSLSDINGLINFIHTHDMQVEIYPSGNCISKGVCNSDIIECFKHKFSCFVTCFGIVYPCAGMPLSIGNLRKNSLEKIINDSEVLENLKNYKKMLKGPCRRCDSFDHCYGCRGRAFALTGDYLGSDPLCPENKDKSDMISYLPMSVENLIPQKAGMRVVSTLLKVGERYAEVESVFSDKTPFMKKNGSLEEIVFMEIIAQSAAVMNGFAQFDTDAPRPEGFLIGGQNIKIHAKAYVGEKLRTEIFKTMKFGDFGILTARIMRKQDLIAQGEIKIYQFEELP